MRRGLRGEKTLGRSAEARKQPSGNETQLCAPRPIGQGSQVGVDGGEHLPSLLKRCLLWETSLKAGGGHSQRNRHPTTLGLYLLSPGPLHSPALQVRYWAWPFSKALTESRATWALLTR